MRKKLLFFYLSSLLAFPSLGRDFEYEYEGQTITYTVIDEDAKTCKTKAGYDEDGFSYRGNDVTGNLVLPSNPKDGNEEYTLTTIGIKAFECSEQLTSVTIPNSVTVIEEWAFSGCFVLNSITMSESLTEIGDLAFGNCWSLTSITIPRFVTKYGWDPFQNCTKLTEVFFNAENCVPTHSGYPLFPTTIERVIIGDGLKLFLKMPFLIVQP